MKIRSAILFSIVLFFGTAAFSQMFEVYGEYSYLRFNPTLSGLNNRSFNGAGGGATFYFAKYLGKRTTNLLLGFSAGAQNSRVASWMNTHSEKKANSKRLPGKRLTVKT